MRIASQVGLFVLLGLAGCGGGDGAGGGSAAGSSQARLSGAVVKGPVADAELCAYALLPSGKGDRLACTRTSSDGSYALALDFAGLVVLEASGGSYIDETTGVATALSTPLASVAMAQRGGTVTAAVTPLTHFAFEQARTSGLDATRFAAASEAVRTAFGTPGLDLVGGSIVLAEGGDNAYGAALRNVSRALANGATLSGLAAGVSQADVQAGLRQAQWCVPGEDGHLADWSVLLEANVGSGYGSTAVTVTVEHPDPAWRASLAGQDTGCTPTVNTQELVTLACRADLPYSLVDLRAAASASQAFSGVPALGELRAAGQRIRVSGQRLAFAAIAGELRISAAQGAIEIAGETNFRGTLSLEGVHTIAGGPASQLCALGSDARPVIGAGSVTGGQAPLYVIGIGGNVSLGWRDLSLPGGGVGGGGTITAANGGSVVTSGGTVVLGGQTGGAGFVVSTTGTP